MCIMVIKVRVLPENRELEVQKLRIRIRDLLKELGLSREEVVVLRNGRVVLEDEIVQDGDNIEVLRAVSGG